MIISGNYSWQGTGKMARLKFSVFFVAEYACLKNTKQPMCFNIGCLLSKFTFQPV